MAELKFVLQNELQIEYNDSVFDRLFELENYRYQIRIRPKNQFWRFGLRFSPHENVPFYAPEGRYNVNSFPNIEWVAGDIPEPSRTENPNHVHLSGYWLPGISNSHIFNFVEDYKPMDEIVVELTFGEQPNILAVSWRATPGQLHTTEIELKGYYFFKLFGWADWHAYRIEGIVHSESIYGEPSNQFWFLKLDNESWNINALSAGYTTIFDTFLPESLNLPQPPRQRPEYDLYLRIKPGDRFIGFEFRKQKAVVCLFEALTGVTKSEGREYIEIKLIKMIDPQIPVGQFLNDLPFAGSLGENTRDRIFPLSSQTFFSILAIDPPSSASLAAQHFLATIRGEGTHEQPDRLGFRYDIQALASVIAQVNVQPPLSVGLFGNWGSGKSFFMKKLADRIDGYAKSNNPQFVRHVVPVHFNSWHYSDANLWASLVTRIFEELEAYGRKKEPKELEKLFESLHSTKELIIENDLKAKQIVTEIEALEDREKQITAEIGKKANELKGVSFFELVKVVFEDKTVKNEVEKVKTDFDFVDTSSIEKLESQADELKTAAGRLSETFKLAYTYSAPKMLLALLIFVGTIYLCYIIHNHVDWLKSASGDIQVFITLLVAAGTQILGFVRPAANKIKILNKQLSGLKTRLDRLKEEKKNEFNAEKAKITASLEEAKAAQQKIRQQKEELITQQHKLAVELADIKSGKKLITFLGDRVSDERYINNLGLISWIRKDFQKLDFLLKQQHESLQDKEDDSEKVASVLKIDRIVLFIDDLDRCSSDTVVQVLEAINLLLAFPLFVAVVGVDPRWLNNALNRKLGKLFGNRSGSMSGKSAAEQGLATSYDYLEKIFQIPFGIKPIDDASGKALLYQLVEKELDQQAAITAAPAIGAGTTTIDRQASAGGGPDTPDSSSTTAAGDEQESSQPLRMSSEELRFMQRLSPLFARTPRHLNRYVNTYRILKSHQGLKIEIPNSPQEYQVVLFLLAVLVGYNDQAAGFFKLIKGDDQSILMKDLLSSVKKELSNPAADFAAVAESNLMVADVGFLQKPLRDFQPNLDLISRFSFRTIDL